MLVQAPGALDTHAQLHGIEVVGHRAGDAGTSEGNQVPDAVGVVAADEVAQVEHSLLVQCPVAVVVAVVVLVGHRLAPDALQLGAETETGSEPLTDSDRCAGVGAELLERAAVESVSVLLIGIPGSPFCASLDEPVAPERVGGDAVLQSWILLSHRGQGHSSQSQYRSNG